MKFRLLTLFLLLGLLIAGCGGPAAPAAAPAAGTATEATAEAAPGVATEATTEAAAAPAGGDLLADIMARGVLRISTDPAYPPQSELVPNAQLVV